MASLYTALLWGASAQPHLLLFTATSTQNPEKAERAALGRGRPTTPSSIYSHLYTKPRESREGCFGERQTTHTFFYLQPPLHKTQRKQKGLLWRESDHPHLLLFTATSTQNPERAERDALGSDYTLAFGFRFEPRCQCISLVGFLLYTVIWIQIWSEMTAHSLPLQNPEKAERAALEKV